MPRDPQALLDWYWDYNGLDDEQLATRSSLRCSFWIWRSTRRRQICARRCSARSRCIEGVDVQTVDGHVTTLSIDIDLGGAQRLTLSLDIRDAAWSSAAPCTARTGQLDHPRHGAGSPGDHDDDGVDSAPLHEAERLARAGPGVPGRRPSAAAGRLDPWHPTPSFTCTCTASTRCSTGPRASGRSSRRRSGRGCRRSPSPTTATRSRRSSSTRPRRMPASSRSSASRRTSPPARTAPTRRACAGARPSSPTTTSRARAPTRT